MILDAINVCYNSIEMYVSLVSIFINYFINRQYSSTKSHSKVATLVIGKFICKLFLCHLKAPGEFISLGPRTGPKCHYLARSEKKV